MMDTIHPTLASDIIIAISSALFSLFVALILFYWHEVSGYRRRKKLLKKIRKIFDKSLDVYFSGRQVVNETKFENLQHDSAREIVYQGGDAEREALWLIADDKTSDGLDQLKKILNNEMLSRWTQIAHIAYPLDALCALEAYREMVKLEPSDIWNHIYLGRSYERTGNLKEAQNTHEKAILLFSQDSDSEERIILHNELGDVLLNQGNLEAAKREYEKGFAMAERLVNADKDNLGWQRTLSISYFKAGDVLHARAEPLKTLKKYRKGFVIAKRLADADKDNLGWQRDLSVSYDKIGDALADLCDLVGALEEYQKGFDIAQTLTDAEPDKIGRQYDLLASHYKLGDVLLRTQKDDLAKALDEYQKGFVIAERFTKTDPNNTWWEHALSIGCMGIGDVRREQNNSAEALKQYRRGFSILGHLVHTDSVNAKWWYDFSISYRKIGDAWYDLGDLRQALEQYRAQLAIVEKLVADDPDHIRWQSTLMHDYMNLDKLKPDEEWWRKALDVADRLRDEGRFPPLDHRLLEELQARRQ